MPKADEAMLDAPLELPEEEVLLESVAREAEEELDALVWLEEMEPGAEVEEGEAGEEVETRDRMPLEMDWVVLQLEVLGVE